MSGHAPHRFEAISVSDESTVVAEFAEARTGSEAYQSEAALETTFIRTLTEQAYEYLPIREELELVANLRTQIELLNDTTFSDAEWERFFRERIAGEKDGIVEKAVRIQEDHIQLLQRDDGSTKNILLIDKHRIHNNRLQVINQYEVEGAYSNRYDVTILVNGLPLVHVELKRRGADLREAFNQINRYQRDSFWAGSGLFEYVQLFVISNGTLTKYYSNSTRSRHVEKAQAGKSRKGSSNSYEFTSWWTDGENRPIQELEGFTKTFFAKHTILNVLTKYSVLQADKTLLVMRPYQIAATERILQRIETSTNARQLGKIEAGGYIWHTTGSGKTLTSFKTAQLASKLESVDKVLFVVDRKDLDYQTMVEYDKFQKGAANSNASTAVLKKQLEDPDARIIITTIQTLSNFVGRHKGHAVYDGHIVLVFDECHRSQFGDMHADITKAFKKYNLFGFTGTPIFSANAATSGNPKLRTTEQAFGERLHSYTIVNAIDDKNVLPFRIDYVRTIKTADELVDRQVEAIDREAALLAPERIELVVAYILEHFDQKTKRAEHYSVQGKRLRGFNSLFATASINAARAYYQEFARQQADRTPADRLKIGLIYTYPANEEQVDGLLDDEGFDATALTGDARSALEDAIRDYNQMFATNYATSGDSFENYYKDLSKRLKDRDLDMVIVVNMLLTGFDAPTLNTLWTDKNLRAHGLMQAYSRTNRILNSVKTYGNIVNFRDLEDETNDAIALFGNPEARGIVLLRPFAEYFADYEDRIATLLVSYPADAPIVGEEAQHDFIALFGSIMRLRNILQAFDEFESVDILTPRQLQDYQSRYLDLYAEWRTIREAEQEPINDDLVFEIELIKQAEVNVDYILLLVQQAREARGDGDDEEILATIDRVVNSSPTLRSKKDLIDAFVNTVSPTGDISEEWKAFVETRRRAELDQIIQDENLDADATRAFIETAFRDGAIQRTGTAVTRILPPVSRFTPDGSHAAKKQSVLDKLAVFVERFVGLVA